MFFQRKNSKKVKNTDASSPKKDKDSRGKNDFFDRAKGGFGALAGSIKSAKNDAEERAAKVQEDVNAGIEAILETGSGILEKAKEDVGGHSETSLSKELGQGSEEQGQKDMDALSSMLDKAKDKVKSNPDVMEKVNSVLDKVKNHPEVMEKVAEVLHLGKRESKEKEPEAEDKTKEGETSADKTQDSNILDQAVEEIQAVVAAVQQQETTGDETQVPVEAAAETDAPAQEEKREVEKDNPKNRIDFLGFFAMIFERFCSPADKKKD
ncbi:hypothetical protein CFC21_035324 [Triticum aestivum]|uniref:Uncharacterized protein n=5 Tax=Triticum TaxID=4564 RepID=A0A9R0RJL0_TRITD|nr:uncharacterized protein LOC119268229 isoform X1 [Triticum dicoccoides]XP_044340324.1 uncharacterized protein LOC123061330 isoform X1 [Triticum aestivum]XP_048563364.1 uncharacterized protein LOC125543908 isoform X1 [Triticum urartu]KAF7022639.1 hypothetical protein CFC21_035324 [Triticum aestivum]VAH61161.1 unnamed protein product [Triticum turgidum subsp. durum]